jgi:serine protease Do/serine protease DegQ
MKYIVILALSFFSSPAYSQQAKKAPNYFEVANTYTVKIKTRVKYPFIKDNRGSHRGAGFLLDKTSGWIMTNAHVSSRNPKSLEVAFKDEKFIDAKLIYVDMLLDLAIIKISPDKIPAIATEAKLDCVNKPVVGKPVGAFGHPFSLSFSGTRGIISGEKYRWGRVWVQTDAPINSGNSGGPLISLTSGKVVGISSATMSKSRSEGLNFAVPMTHACKVVDLLRRGLDPTPSYIPVGFAYDDDNDSELIAAVIYKKQPTSWPLEVGDRLVSFASTPKDEFKNQAMLVHQLRGVRGKVDVVIERDGRKKILSIMSKPRTNLMKRIGVHVSGVVIAPENFRDDEEANPKGLALIQDVARASIGRSAGIKAYDLLISIDGKTMANPTVICRYLKTAEKAKRKIKLITKEGDWSYRSHSKYHAYEIKAKDVRLVGPKAPEGCG